MTKKKLLLGTAGLVALLLLVAAGALVLWFRGGLPSRGGEHQIYGLGNSVSVRWDRWGVPALLAENEDDLATGLGWIHANDRFTQMELGRRAAFGRLSEILGEPTVEIDIYFRRHRFGPTAEKIWREAQPRGRRWLEAYARGVNAWLEERGSDLPPELRLLGARPEPWEGKHSVAFALLMARDLSFWNGRPEENRFLWLRAFGPDKVRELLSEPDLHIPTAILELARSSATKIESPASLDEPNLASPGSNNWALGPSRTDSDKALVANDPHLALGLPSIWYQIHLRAPGFESAGMTLPGAPAVILGRGAHLAWAFTNTMLDDHDVFFEIVDEKGEHVRRGEEWVPIQAEDATIRIRGGTSRSVKLRSTDLGPLFEADEARGLPARSLRWTAHEGGDPLTALLELATATSEAEVRAAIKTYTCPAQNLVVAFESGETLFTVLGRIPQRRQGEGRMPSPAWDPAYGWDGLRPRDTNPLVVSPEDGMIVTANHNILPADYPLPLTADFVPGHRAQRIRESLVRKTSWNWESVGELQADVVSLYARDVLEALGDEYGGEHGGENEGKYEDEAGQAWEALSSWDHEMAAQGVSALYALFEKELLDVFADEMEVAGVQGPAAFNARGLVLRLLRGEMEASWFDDVRTPEAESRSDFLARALTSAWVAGRDRWGTNITRWSYGEIHQLILRHQLDAVPLLGGWLRRGPFEATGSATTVSAFGAAWKGDHMEVTFGPSMRWIVDWGQPEMAFAMLPGGQSGHPADPHYDDQIQAFLDGRLRPAPWSEEQIQSVVVRTMTLRP